MNWEDMLFSLDTYKNYMLNPILELEMTILVIHFNCQLDVNIPELIWWSKRFEKLKVPQ